MRKGDVLCGIIAFVLVILILGAVGGVDNGQIGVGRCLVYIIGLCLMLTADVKICEFLYYDKEE